MICFLGPDESSGYKQAAYHINSGGQILEENPENKKKEKKPTKSLYSSQFSIVQIRAVLPDGTVKVLFVNKFANSIFGHQPLRHRLESSIIKAPEQASTNAQALFYNIKRKLL